MRETRQRMLGGLLVALIPSLAVFAAIENPSRLQRNLTYVLLGLVVVVLILFIGTTRLYLGWRFERRRRRDWIRRASPQITSGMSGGVPHSASFILRIPEGTDEGHQPPYIATIERQGFSALSVPVSIERGNAVRLHWPEGFEAQSPKLNRGRYLLTWRDQGSFTHELQFSVNRHGFLRPKLTRHIPERISILKSMGDD